MTKRITFVLILATISLLALALTVSAKTGAAIDDRDASRAALIDSFNLQGTHAPMQLYSEETADQLGRVNIGSSRRPVGSAFSPNLHTGIGESVALTWDDNGVFYPVGRHISHYYNGLTGIDAEVDVHFTYEQVTDTTPTIFDSLPLRQTGYNVFDATVPPNGDWPRGQDLGCNLQAIDTLGTGVGSNFGIVPQNGRVAFIADARLFTDTLIDGEWFEDITLFYQGGQYSCTYVPGVHTSFIDTTVFKLHWNDASDGNHSSYPMMATQFDGTNLVTHVGFFEETAFDPPPSADYADNTDYRTFVYFRKVGDGIAGTWGTGRILDTIERNFADLIASPFSGEVAVIYSNPSVWGAQLNEGWDKDAYYRESTNFGADWGGENNMTNFQNAIVAPAGSPTHASLYYEVKGLYSSDGNLHVLYQATPTSSNPYFDGYNFMDFNQDLYHWDRNSGDKVRVGRGTYMNPDYLTGSINTVHCGFGGDPAGYLQFFNLSECNDKLYAIWNQTHVWANDGDYNADPSLLTDCALGTYGDRLTVANWEIVMSVADMATSACWDPPRKISNTFTPECGLPGDPDAVGLCGNEYKPYVEHYGLNEAGLDLYWPTGSIVDMTPAGEPAYSGDYYLNAEYLDDPIPGPGWNPDAREPNGYMNLVSVKWLRIACVEPVQASLIELSTRILEFPAWVQFGTVGNFEITVTNGGNQQLNVYSMTAVETSPVSGWLGTDQTFPPDFTVAACLNNKETFNITIDATSISTTQWLEGMVYLKSDAADFDSIGIALKVLAAADVEDVLWDTVMTNSEMYDPYGIPEGECIGLAVGNHGEMGYSLAGEVNLDFVQSTLECGERDRDGIYLATGTAYTLDADAAGENVLISMSGSAVNQLDEYSFDPIGELGTMTGGLGTGIGPNTVDYDSVYTGRFVNRDTTIAWERVVYAPRNDVDHSSFMVTLNKVYSADGAGHDNIAIGSLADWDIPAEEVPENISDESVAGNFVYMQGTDTTTILSCQSNTSRFATEAFGEQFPTMADACDDLGSASYYGAWSGYQMLMEDTNFMRDAVTPIDPPAPDGQAWWDDIEANPGNLGYNTVEDQAIWLTVVFDHNLAAEDTIYFWTVYSTVRNGTLADLEGQVAYAKTWFKEEILPGLCAGGGTGCCIGTVGNVNGDIEEKVTIGDIAVLVNHLFIEKPLVDCILEADVNQSGGTTPTQINPGSSLTIGDVAVLTDYLFITTPEIYGPLLTCLEL